MFEFSKRHFFFCFSLGLLFFNFEVIFGFGNEENVDLYILGLIELTTKFGKRDEGYAEMEAAKIAINRINEMNLLSRYNLTLIVNDTQVHI